MALHKNDYTAAVFRDEQCITVLSGSVPLMHETLLQKLKQQIIRTVRIRKAVEMISKICW